LKKHNQRLSVKLQAFFARDYLCTVVVIITTKWWMDPDINNALTLPLNLTSFQRCSSFFLLLSVVLKNLLQLTDPILKFGF
jgi:hypothetical protein